MASPVPKKYLPPLSIMWSVLTCVFLTRCALCPHFCRRHLQTNMAVRLCDVASLLRSGSWAAEPWTGVCGTSSSLLILISYFSSLLSFQSWPVSCGAPHYISSLWIMERRVSSPGSLCPKLNSNFPKRFRATRCSIVVTSPKSAPFLL